MFGHSGWCATQEDWLDSARMNDDYVPQDSSPMGQRHMWSKGIPSVSTCRPEIKRT